MTKPSGSRSSKPRPASLVYCTVHPAMKPHQYIRTNTIHTNTLACAVNNPSSQTGGRKSKIVCVWREGGGGPRDRPAGRGWRKLRGHDSLAGTDRGRGKRRGREKNKGSSGESEGGSPSVQITQPSPGPGRCKHTPYTPARATPVILLIEPKARSTLLRSAQV